MQATGGKKSTARHVKDCINFRPSANLKHIKKYLQSKFEETCGSGNFEFYNETTKSKNNFNTQNSNILKNSTQSTTKKQEKTSIKQEPKATPNKITKHTSIRKKSIHPPLSLNSPPISPELKIKVRQDGYGHMNMECQTGMEQITVNNTEPHKQNPQKIQKHKQTEVQKLTEPTMCRNFIRGICNKGETCTYVHKVILSQLPSVYIFCKNYQNRKCTFDRCKFVHANVIEKKHFFRTGYLPPHSTAHLKQSAAPAMIQPSHKPPPPSQPPQAEELPVQDVFSSYYGGMDMETESNMGVKTKLPALSRMAGSKYESQKQNDNNMYAAGPSTSSSMSTTTSPIEKNCIETITSDKSSNGYPNVSTAKPKKCENCDTNESRVNLHRNKIQSKALSSEEWDKEIAILDAKSERLCTVFMALFKSEWQNSSALQRMTSGFGDSEKAFLEQIGFLTPANDMMQNRKFARS